MAPKAVQLKSFLTAEIFRLCKISYPNFCLHTEGEAPAHPMRSSPVHQVRSVQRLLNEAGDWTIWCRHDPLLWSLPLSVPPWMTMPEGWEGDVLSLAALTKLPLSLVRAGADPTVLTSDVIVVILFVFPKIPLCFSALLCILNIQIVSALRAPFVIRLHWLWICPTGWQASYADLHCKV